MPSRSKKVAREVARLPSIPKELVSLFLTGPMTGEAINAAGLALKKALAEASLNAELSHHLGYEAGADRPELVTNQRNGSTAKSVLTGDGTIRIDAPRDRDGSFEPVLVPKHARRFTGFDNKVTALYAREIVVMSGVTVTVKVAHVRLCHSRMMFFRAYPRETQEMVFDAHERAFAFFKGACTRGIYDNMKTAVDTIFVGKGQQYNRRFLQMCSHHLVDPVACTPASGWEKGQVENQVGLVRERSFTPRLRVKTYDELNAWLIDNCVVYAKAHPHPERPEQTVWEVFEEERPKLVAYRGRFDAVALRAGSGPQAGSTAQRCAVQGLGAAGCAGAGATQARRVRRWRSPDGRHSRHRAHGWIAGGRSRLRPGDVRRRPLIRCDHQHSRPPTRSRPGGDHPHAGCVEAPACAGRRLRQIRSTQERMSMERTEVLDMMGELKLFGMKGAYDETLATAIKRKHEPQRLVGDLLKAEISEKQARSIRYQLTIAKLPLAKDVDDFAFKGTPINENLVRDLAGGNFIAQQRTSWSVGPVPARRMYRQRCRIRGRGEDGWSIATVTRRSDRGSGPAPMRRCRTVAILPLAAGRWASPALRAPQRLDDVTKSLRPGLGRRE